MLIKAYGADPPVLALRGVSFSVASGESWWRSWSLRVGQVDAASRDGHAGAPELGSGLDYRPWMSPRSPTESLAAVRATRIGFVFQQFFLAEHSTALENVADGLLYGGAPVAERRARAGRGADARRGSANRLDARPTQLIGRRAPTASRSPVALVGRPAIVLADEPTGNLDSANSQAIMTLIDELNAEGATIVVITHEHEIAARFPRQITLLDGRIVSDETKEGRLMKIAAILVLAAATLSTTAATAGAAGSACPAQEHPNEIVVASG